MTKSKLNLDSLAVESFDTVDAGEMSIRPTLGSCTCYSCGEWWC